MTEISVIQEATNLLDQASAQITTAGQTVDHARRLFDQESTSPQSAATGSAVRESRDTYLHNRAAGKDPIAAARRLIALRKARDETLQMRHLFVDPAWEILLDLFIASDNMQPVAISHVCASIAIPQSTALRYIRALEDFQLIERSPSGPDKSEVYVALRGPARRSMITILSQQGEG